MILLWIMMRDARPLNTASKYASSVSPLVRWMHLSYDIERWDWDCQQATNGQTLWLWSGSALCGDDGGLINKSTHHQSWITTVKCIYLSTLLYLQFSYPGENSGFSFPRLFMLCLFVVLWPIVNIVNYSTELKLPKTSPRIENL